ncbi:MAG TPA: type IV pilin [Methanocella sp.]|nr:type IV pilin [Methanocella sp.]
MAINEEALSDLIGELMMLAITVIVFVILITAVSSMTVRPHVGITHMNALAINDTTFAVQNTGGDSVTYSHLAVVVNGQLIPPATADIDGNGQWDTGESLYISTNTRQNLSIIVYDRTQNAVLGNFNLG